MKTILFSFENAVDRDQFLKFLSEHNDVQSVNAALGAVRFDPPVKTSEERHAALYVGGTKLSEGSLTNIEKMFKQECAAHSAKVEIREFKNGEWHKIRSRTTPTV